MRTTRMAMRLAKIVLGLVAAVLLLAGVLLWLAGTEPALRWAAQQAETLSTGKLAVRGVHGSFYGPLRIEALSFATEEKRFELQEATLDWSPAALLRRHIQIDAVDLQELRVVELKPSAAPPELPKTLRLPASLSIPKARIARIVLMTGKTEYVLTDIALAVEKPADTYRLTLASLTTPWGHAQAEATLAETTPFALAGRTSLEQERGWPYALQVTLAGALPRIALTATATSGAGKAEADAILAPFDKRPLAEARLEASGIDPARIDKDLPRAEISARVTLRSQGAEAFAGEISAENTQPGPWDKDRLPLRALAAGFAGTPDRVDLGTLSLDLGKGGRFAGGGHIAGEHLQLTLSTRSFDPRGVHSRLRSMRLAGDLRLEADAQSQALVADLSYQRYRLHLDVAQRNETLEIKEAVARSAGGSLSLFGTLALVQPRRFQVAGALDGFEPAAFGDYPPARVNASFTGTGRLAPEPEAALRFAIADSHFRRQPLSGQGGLNLSAQRIWDSDVGLRLGRNRLQAKGSLGAPGDQLAFHLDAYNLAVLDPDLAGRVNASGTLEGRIVAPSGAFDLKAEALRWQKDYRVASLRASGRLEQGLDGLLAMDASARDVITPQIKLEQASLLAKGTRTQHALQLTAKNPDFDLEGSLSGGWHDDDGWSGQLLSLVNRGRHPLALKAPARLEAAPEHFRLAGALFDFAGGSLKVQEVAYKAGQIASQGEFKGLPVKYLQQFAAQSAELESDLRLGGEWRLNVLDTVNGRIALWREGGDITLPSVAQIALGLNRLTLDIEAVDNRIAAKLEAGGTHLGTLKAEAQSLLSRRDGAWGIAGDAGLQAAADLAAPSLAWAAPLIDKTGALTLDGALQAQVRGSGSFGQPKLSGSLAGERFQMDLPEQGMQFRDGRFLAELQDQALVLKDLSLRGGQGSLTGQGRLALKGGAPDMQVALKADKLEVLSRPDRHLILSGTGEASVVENKVQVVAKLKAERGLIELPKGDTPSPSADVVVLGREEQAAKKGLPYAVRLDLDLDLGERFFLKGRGLDAQLGGAVKLASVNGSLPRASGSIRVVKGTYSAYGQRLDIERGILNFQGPVDNPGLNIVALRKNQDVEAGVALSGSAQAPRVKLVSNPTLPDSEKLSWLVLGHGVEGSSGQDFSALQAAAGALLAAGESVTLQQRIARAAGLEEVGLKGAGTLESTVLTLGKRLSSKAYLSYEQGLVGSEALVKINYTLSKRLSVRAQAGTTPAVDLFYTFSFD